MGLIEVIMIALGLAMDAFAVSVCKGLAMTKVKLRDAAIVGLWFGGFQALMPAIGYFLGSRFAAYIEAYDHWIAFGLLLIIGANMIKESFDSVDVYNRFFLKIYTYNCIITFIIFFSTKEKITF